MAGYNVTTPPLFTVNDPIMLVNHNLGTLNATLTVPDRPTTVSSSPILAEDLLGGFITVTNTGSHQWDKGKNVIDALSRKLWRLTNSGIIQNGSTISCVIDNRSGGIVNIYDNTGSHGYVSIGAGETAKVTIFILDQTKNAERVAFCSCETASFNPS